MSPIDFRSLLLQASALLLILDLKLSFLINLIMRAGSDDPESSLSYTTINLSLLVASHDALSVSSSFPSLHSLSIDAPLCI